MDYCLPILVLIIIIYSYSKKVDIYNKFLEGAKEGIKTVFDIVPAVVGMVFAINLFVKSGVINFLLCPFNSLFTKINIPNEVATMALLRPISGNASLAIMNNIFTKYGVDSFYGLVASVLQGCTDTTVYVLALYFGSVKISKSKYALKVGLFADLCGIGAAFILCHIFFTN